MNASFPYIPESLRSQARRAFRSLPSSVQSRVLIKLDRHAPWDNGHPPEAPPAPAGLTKGPPDFVGIGVPKCGTTWWFSLIMAHPGIYVQNAKELNFFNRWFIRHLNSQGCAQADLERYHEWFPRPPGKLTGEWTPHYVFQYQVPPLMKLAAPMARMIVMLRDPVERYQSDISRHMNRQRLRMTQYRSIGNGFYASILKPWEDIYSPSELLILQYEACLQQPEVMLKLTYEFLGVETAFQPNALRTVVNKTRAKLDIDPGMRTLLTQIYEREVACLVARHPNIDLRLWPNFAGMLDRPESAMGGGRSGPKR
jgi:hypothetical protein